MSPASAVDASRSAADLILLGNDLARVAQADLDAAAAAHGLRYAPDPASAAISAAWYGMPEFFSRSSSLPRSGWFSSRWRAF